MALQIPQFPEETGWFLSQAYNNDFNVYLQVYLSYLPIEKKKYESGLMETNTGRPRFVT
jgi:hypothetical protein